MSLAIPRLSGIHSSLSEIHGHRTRGTRPTVAAAGPGSPAARAVFPVQARARHRRHGSPR